MSERTFIYFPSLSVGEFASHLVKPDYKINDKLSIKFYNSEYGKYRYPYFLVSGGHHLKTPRAKWGFEDDVTVMGDSGGFQICSGAKKWDNSTLEKTFLWLEANNDISINLDIPPRAEWAGKFNQALDISMKNFEYFHTNQTGKTKFLNVMQGQNHDEITAWYKAASQFDKFSGWSIGGAGGKEYILFEMLATLFKNKEHLKPHNKYLHILGISSIDQCFLLSCLQKALNDIGSPMQITTDSSSPGLAIVFGTCYTGANWDKLSTNAIKLPQKLEGGYMLPRCTAFDDLIAATVNKEDFAIWGTTSRNSTVLHNVYVLLDIIKSINSIVYSGEYMIKEFISKPVYLQMFSAINELVKSDNPEAVVEKYRPLIMSLGKINYSVDRNNTFFNFD